MVDAMVVQLVYLKVDETVSYWVALKELGTAASTVAYLVEQLADL